ncbi:hypothetical protein [Natrinema salinisoli]|uniref:hypothetical protein n=1 Tax=Natrinema salinisoli TaxID=2878535 RepID=UPI001CF0BD6D|nr:hypothetical protein [Natrinema salinisoli]
MHPIIDRYSPERTRSETNRHPDRATARVERAAVGRRATVGAATQSATHTAVIRGDDR